MTFSPNRVAIERLKTLLEDEEAKDFEYLIAHIEALIPTSEAIRDYLRKGKREFKLLNVDPSDPTIPYRARRWRAHLLIYNICYLPVYERVGNQVRKIPSSEITTTITTQQHNNTKAGKDNGSK